MGLACRLKTDVFVLIIKLTEVWFSAIKHENEKTSRKKSCLCLKSCLHSLWYHGKYSPRKLKVTHHCVPILQPGVCLSVTITGAPKIRRQGLTVFRDKFISCKNIDYLLLLIYIFQILDKINGDNKISFYLNGIIIES